MRGNFLLIFTKSKLNHSIRNIYISIVKSRSIIYTTFLTLLVLILGKNIADLHILGFLISMETDKSIPKRDSYPGLLSLQLTVKFWHTFMHGTDNCTLLKLDKLTLCIAILPASLTMCGCEIHVFVADSV